MSLGLTARCLLIGATLLLAGYCVYVLVPAGTMSAWVMAGLCVGFPLAAWWEASRLREQGSSEAADVLIVWTMSAVLAFTVLADHAQSREQRARAECIRE